MNISELFKQLAQDLSPNQYWSTHKYNKTSTEYTIRDSIFTVIVKDTLHGYQEIIVYTEVQDRILFRWNSHYRHHLHASEVHQVMHDHIRNLEQHLAQSRL